MSLDVIVAHEGAREAVRAALMFPGPLGRLLIQYLTLFRPAKRQLTLDRVSTILAELLEIINSGKIKYKGKDYAIDQSILASAIEGMIERHREKQIQTPLKNHNYLFAILSQQMTTIASAKKEKAESQRACPGPIKIKRAGMPVSISGQLEKFRRGLAEPAYSLADLEAVAKGQR